MKKNIKTLAALLIASATFVACSSDNDSIIDNQQPANPTGKYTMTINASKGDGATTRALNLTDHTLNATWDEGEVVLVYQGDSQIGTLYSAASITNETSLTGTLGSAPDAGQDLTLYFHTATDPATTDDAYAGQDGTLAKIASTYDFCAPATITAGSFTVNSANHTISVPAGISFGANQQAIIKFTLKDKANDAAISPSALTVTDGTSTVKLTSIPAATYTANGGDNNVLYVAFPAAGTAKTVTLTATAGGKTYSYEKTGVSFTNGKYYEIGVKMSPIISLSDRTKLDDEFVIPDGYIVTGSAVGLTCKVAVAEGATVTLRDVENTGNLDGDPTCPGIKCKGDATIILEGNNTVTGGGTYAGIYVPEGNTLTIRGTGSLTVTGGSGGAGIGGNSGGNCGSIVISGGTITATGGSGGAGIGLGYSSGCVFGDITISGGTVTATGSGDAPGIGGPYANFQDITITDGVTKVTVNKGSSSPYSIGTSEIDEYGYYGAITIGGTVYFNEGSFVNGGDSYLQTSPLVYQP